MTEHVDPEPKITEENNTLIIVAYVVGALLLITLVISVAYCISRIQGKKQKYKSELPQSNTESTMDIISKPQKDKEHEISIQDQNDEIKAASSGVEDERFK